MSVFVAQARC